MTPPVLVLVPPRQSAVRSPRLKNFNVAMHGWDEQILIPGKAAASRAGARHHRARDQVRRGEFDDAPHAAGAEMVMDDEQLHSTGSVSPRKRAGEPFQVLAD